MNNTIETLLRSPIPAVYSGEPKLELQIYHLNRATFIGFSILLNPGTEPHNYSLVCYSDQSKCAMVEQIQKKFGTMSRLK